MGFEPIWQSFCQYHNIFFSKSKFLTILEGGELSGKTTLFNGGTTFFLQVWDDYRACSRLFFSPKNVTLETFQTFWDLGSAVYGSCGRTLGAHPGPPPIAPRDEERRKETLAMMSTIITHAQIVLWSTMMRKNFTGGETTSI